MAVKVRPAQPEDVGMGRQVTQFVALVLGIVVVSALAPAAAAAAPPQGGKPGYFVSHCTFSHRLADDPIVVPGVPGGSHAHDFFGNESTDALSTTPSLQSAATSCLRPEDKSAYWVPTLFMRGRVVDPIAMRAYYRFAGSPSRVSPFPTGLRVVAGSAKAASEQSTAVTSWLCKGANRHGVAADPGPSCHEGERLRLRVLFPSCWDGKNLDSPDHRSHMAYAERGICPSTHAVSVPRLILEVSYRIRGGIGLSLASGAITTAHADFFNAWDPDTQRGLVQWCLREGRPCDESPSVAPTEPPTIKAVPSSPSVCRLATGHKRWYMTMPS